MAAILARVRHTGQLLKPGLNTQNASLRFISRVAQGQKSLQNGLPFVESGRCKSLRPNSSQLHKLENWGQTELSPIVRSLSGKLGTENWGQTELSPIVRSLSGNAKQFTPTGRPLRTQEFVSALEAWMLRPLAGRNQAGPTTLLPIPTSQPHPSRVVKKWGQSHLSPISGLLMEGHYTQVPTGLWKSLGLVVRDVSKNNAVPFPNPLDPPVLSYGRLVREVYIPSESRADPQSLGCQPCSVAVRKSQDVSPSESNRGGYTV